MTWGSFEARLGRRAHS